MDCKRIKKMMSEYIDGELKEADIIGVKEHLKSCKKCAEYLSEYQRSWDLLKIWQDVSPLPGFESLFWTRLTSRRSLREKVLEKIRIILAPKRIAYGFATALLVFVLINFSIYKTDELRARSVIMNFSEDEWDMIEDYELIANLDALNGSGNM